MTRGIETLHVGIGGIGVSNTSGEILRTLALGSCVALLVHDPVSRATALAHIALPDSRSGTPAQDAAPGYYADLAVPETFRLLRMLGFLDVFSRPVVSLVGGSASMLGPGDSFNIGERNVEAIRRLVVASKLAIAHEDVGGRLSRTVEIEVGTGRIRITSPTRRPLEF